MKKTIAVISLLHEKENANSANRLFRQKPVLAWTISRAGKIQGVSRICVIGIRSQESAIAEACAGHDCSIDIRLDDCVTPAMLATSASLRWAGGWRGGLLGACHFDNGFSGGAVLENLAKHDAEQALLIDPSAGLIDPELNGRLIGHASKFEQIELFFTQSSPGLCGVVVRKSLVERLAKTGGHPGKLLSYWPDVGGRDPMTSDACMAVAPTLARSAGRYTMDSQRQVKKLGQSLSSLNGHLIHASAQALVEMNQSARRQEPLPALVVVELTTRRESAPVFLPQVTTRGEMDFELAKKVITDISTIDDVRLELKGAGDPLTYSRLAELIYFARESGIGAIHVETDLLSMSEDMLGVFSSGAVDVVSVQMPGLSPGMYERMMGVDGLKQVLVNVTKIAKGRMAIPIVVPTFVKCKANFGEMEAWYDHWLRTLGCAVIRGASDFCGTIADLACADMAATIRKPCRRVFDRMKVLSDGRVAACEEDASGAMPMGYVVQNSIAEIWQMGMTEMQMKHANGQWGEMVTCKGCRQWHRP